LLAVPLLMRYEDWTFREAETRLREHQELRATLQLQTVPDYTTLYRFLQRLPDDTIDRGLRETVARLRQRRSRAVWWRSTGRASLTIPSAVSSSGAWNSKPSAVRAIVIG
jgi:hypothetical protein